MNPLHVLSVLSFAGFLVLFLLRKASPNAIRKLSLAWSLSLFAVSLLLLPAVHEASANAEASSGGYSFLTRTPWIPSLGISYQSGVDGVSVYLVLLATLLTPVAVLSAWNSIQSRTNDFFALLFLLEFGLIGVFSALDLFLFYLFWEVALVPMYLLIGIWGHDRGRIAASIKFFLYTMAGSVLMLASIIYLYVRGGTFDFLALLGKLNSGQLVFTGQEQMLLFLGFFLAFAIKVPLFPLHTWLPETYLQAPTPAVLMLAAVMSKMGAYGLVRFCLPLFPGAARQNAYWIVTLAIIGILFGALVALIQPNYKKLIAYSSVSHLGFVMLGIFSFNQLALDGAVYQMVSHGISTGALFVLAGFLYERKPSLEIASFGGVAASAPGLATVFLISALASMGLPTLCNFVGEYLILQGSALVDFRWTAFAAAGVILSACYMLWMYQRTFLGEPAVTAEATPMMDLSKREWAAAVPLLALMLWLGVAAETFLPAIGAATARTLEYTTRGVEMQVNSYPLVQPASVPAMRVAR